VLQEARGCGGGALGRPGHLPAHSKPSEWPFCSIWLISKSLAQAADRPIGGAIQVFADSFVARSERLC
jgi:hypothetical protein